MPDTQLVSGGDNYLTEYDGIQRTLDCKDPCYCMTLGGRDGYITFRLLNARETAFCEMLETGGHHGSVIKIIVSRCILDSVPLANMSAGALASVVSLILSWSGVGISHEDINVRIREGMTRVSTMRGILELVAMRCFPYTVEQLASMDLVTLIKAACYTSVVLGVDPPQIELPKKDKRGVINVAEENKAMDGGNDPTPDELQAQRASMQKEIQQNRKLRQRYGRDAAERIQR